MSDRVAIVPEGVMRSKAWAPLTGRARAVLVALWLYAGGDDRQCWPSKADIAFWAGDISRSSVTRALGELETAGLVKRLRKSGGRSDSGGGVTGLYELIIPTGANLRPLPTKNGRNAAPVDHHQGAQSCAQGAQSCTNKGRTGEPGNSTENSTKNKGARTATRSAPPVMTFPTRGGTWTLTTDRLERYRQTYPSLDLDRELSKARQWCEDNTTKRKTARGMPGFLTRWLNRADGDRQGGTTSNGHPASAAELFEAIRAGRISTADVDGQHIDLTAADSYSERAIKRNGTTLLAATDIRKATFQ